MPCFGLIPAIPAIRKYVEVRSKFGENSNEVTVEAALISAWPVTSWQMEPSFVQCTSGKSGENPGTVMFCASRLNSGMLYHAFASSTNCMVVNSS